MEPRAHSSFVDDFLGWYINTDWYTRDEAFGQVDPLDKTGGDPAYNGTLMVRADRFDGDYAELRSDGGSPVVGYSTSRTYKFIARFRFRFTHTTGIMALLGLINDLNNFLVIELDCDNDGTKVYMHSRAISTSTRRAISNVPDTNWHTLEIRAEGALADVECVLDGDEATKVTFVEAELPDTMFGLWAYCEATSSVAAGQERALHVDYWATAEERA